MVETNIVAPRPVERITVLQGEALVSSSPTVEFTTVLGSCVSTCLFDPAARTGGMNHFLLAEPPSGWAEGTVDEHYGVYLMELLINEMMKRGATKSGMRAHLYGGANMHSGMLQIGTVNAAFARQFLVREGILLVREDLGGCRARRIEFRPAVGQVRCRAVENSIAPPPVATPRAPNAFGEVELFN